MSYPVLLICFWVSPAGFLSDVVLWWKVSDWCQGLYYYLKTAFSLQHTLKILFIKKKKKNTFYSLYRDCAYLQHVLHNMASFPTCLRMAFLSFLELHSSINTVFSLPAVFFFTSYLQILFLDRVYHTAPWHFLCDFIKHLRASSTQFTSTVTTTKDSLALLTHLAILRCNK